MGPVERLGSKRRKSGKKLGRGLELRKGQVTGAVGQKIRAEGEGPKNKAKKKRGVQAGQGDPVGSKHYQFLNGDKGHRGPGKEGT